MAKLKTAANQVIVKKLSAELELYDDNIGDDPSEANNHYMKGVTLVKLSNYSDDDSLIAKALGSYNEAIRLEPSNPLYLIDRSKLYLSMGKVDLARKDFAEAHSIGSSGDAVADLYIKKAEQEISKKIEIGSAEEGKHDQPLMHESRSSESIALVPQIVHDSGQRNHRDSGRSENNQGNSIGVQAGGNSVKASNKANKSKDCLVSYVTAIEYDNELLNHLELLKEAVGIYGLNKVLNLSDRLSLDLVTIAIETDDCDVVLAGIMSLDSSI